jgi:hypothetical protein
VDAFKQKMLWKKYNRELADRGSLTIYLGDDLASKWASNNAADRGRPEVYPDPVILLGLILQQVYRLPLRQPMASCDRFLNYRVARSRYPIRPPYAAGAATWSSLTGQRRVDALSSTQRDFKSGAQILG